MMQHNIFITELDMEKLRQLLEGAQNSASKDKEHLAMLEEELDRARLVSAGRVPADVVTMNSRVRMTDLDTGKEMTYTLVFPRDADFSQGKISMLAPIGTAILGYRAGDVIEWNVPGGKRKFRVEEILHQPEAAERAARVLPRRAVEIRNWECALASLAGHVLVAPIGLPEQRVGKQNESSIFRGKGGACSCTAQLWPS